MIMIEKQLMLANRLNVSDLTSSFN